MTCKKTSPAIEYKSENIPAPIPKDLNRLSRLRLIASSVFAVFCVVSILDWMITSATLKAGAMIAAIPLINSAVFFINSMISLIYYPLILVYVVSVFLEYRCQKSISLQTDHPAPDRQIPMLLLLVSFLLLFRFCVFLRFG